MSFVAVSSLFLQIVFTWMLSPLFAGVVMGITYKDSGLILKPYKDLLEALRGTKQTVLLAWAVTMVLALLIPTISLRAPLDWMGDTTFMWSLLLLGQLLLVKKEQRSLLLLSLVSFGLFLLSAIFLGGAFNSTLLLSNGAFFSIEHISVAIVMLVLLVGLSSRFLLITKSRYDLSLWVGWTSVWLVVLWGSAIIFPSTLALAWDVGALGVSFGFLLIKALVTMMVLILATFLHRSLSLKVALVLQLMVLLFTAGLFSYLVLA